MENKFVYAANTGSKLNWNVWYPALAIGEWIDTTEDKLIHWNDWVNCTVHIL